MMCAATCAAFWVCLHASCMLRQAHPLRRSTSAFMISLNACRSGGEDGVIIKSWEHTSLFLLTQASHQIVKEACMSSPPYTQVHVLFTGQQPNADSLKKCRPFAAVFLKEAPDHLHV